MTRTQAPAFRSTGRTPQSWNRGQAGVDLHDLPPVPSAGVGHVHADAVSGFVRLHRQAGIFERGVAQAEPERIERRLLQEAVRPPLHRVIREVPQLRVPAVEGHGKTAAGREAPGQKLRHGLAAARAGVPGLQHGFAVPAGLFPDVDRAAAEHRDDQVVGRLAEGFQEALLGFRQEQGGPVAVEARAVLLALDRFIQPHAGDGDVRVAGGGNRVGQQAALPGPGVGGLLRGKPGAFRIQQTRFGEHAPDALQDCAGFGGRAVVVAPQGRAGIGVGADHRDAADSGAQRQEVVRVFQQHQRFLRHPEVQRPVFLAVHAVEGDVREGAVFLELAQKEAGGEQADGRAVDVRLLHHVLLPGVRQRVVVRSAVQVAAALQRQGGGLRRGFRHVVVLVDVRDGAAVGHDVAGELPFSAQDALQQVGMGAAGLAVHAVVRAHHALHARLGDQRLEGGQVGFPQVLHADFGVEFVAEGLRAAVDGEMLGAGGGFQERPVPLQPPDEGRPHRGGEERVLPVGFLPPPPAGVAENIHVGGPVGQAAVDAVVARPHAFVVFGAPLVGDRRRHAPEQRGVERGRHADRLREHGGGSGAGHTVQRLVPPVVGVHAQPVDRLGGVDKLGDLLRDGHFGHERRSAGGRFLSCHQSTSFPCGAAVGRPAFMLPFSFSGSH